LLIFWQETAQLEAKAFELEQSTALAAEAKSVLDSWVRYEGQVKIRQQKELSETIIGKIQKELENPKVLQQILQQSVVDVESKHLYRILSKIIANAKNRDCCIQSTIDLEKISRAKRFPLSPVLFITLLCHSRLRIFSPKFAPRM
jgi:F-type H+-transporting ATPase subunit b